MNTRDLDVGDKVKVKLINTETQEQKWVPGRVSSFGTKLVYVRLRESGRAHIWPFEGRDIKRRR